MESKSSAAHKLLSMGGRIIKGGRDKDKAAFLINDQRLASSTAGVAAQ